MCRLLISGNKILGNKFKMTVTVSLGQTAIQNKSRNYLLFIENNHWKLCHIKSYLKKLCVFFNRLMCKPHLINYVNSTHGLYKLYFDFSFQYQFNSDHYVYMSYICISCMVIFQVNCTLVQVTKNPGKHKAI